jgi:hypothetical protein
MSITDKFTIVGAWIGKGELNFPEANDGKTPRARAEQDRVRVPLLAFVLS